MVVDEESTDESYDDFKYTLVGKLLTEKPVKFNFMRDTLAAVWRPGKGMSVKEISSNLFLFQLFHEVDMKRILEDGPWAYEHSLLVLTKMEPNISPYEAQLNRADFWI